MPAIPLNKTIDANRIKNNGATVVFGASRGNTVTNAPAKNHVAKLSFIYDYIPAGPYSVGEQGDYNHMTAKAVSASSRFGNQVNRAYIIMGITRSIGGVSNTILLGAPKSNSIRPIHFKEFVRSRQTNGKTINYFTGRYTTNVPTQLDQYAPLNGTSRDDAARPTLTVPGEFVVRWGTRSDPLMRDYRAKTG